MKRVEERCHARIGLMGNPSDGFDGKTIAFLIDNYAAKVVIQEVQSCNDIRGVISIAPHQLSDPLQFNNLVALHQHFNTYGYEGGLRLIQATCKVFADYCKQFHLFDQAIFLDCVNISYDTNIPRMVGLSGSSAIIVATFKALLRYYNLTINDFGINKEGYPQVILDVEKVELGITAGLQDRVIQTYGGLVHMDFSSDFHDSNRYTPMDPRLLPKMYLAYNIAAGGNSGRVHSTVKERWINKDPELIEGMKVLASYADEAKSCLLTGDVVGLANLMEQNFEMRRKLYGDAVVGMKNIEMVNLAKQFGLSAKFTGSGGALICIQKNGEGWFEESIEQSIREPFLQNGFQFVRISIPSVSHADSKK